MRLSLRFIVPLVLALGAIAYAVAPLVDDLTLKWFVRDLDMRTRLRHQRPGDRRRRRGAAGVSGGRLALVNPAALGARRGYSNGVLAPAGSGLLFVAGQVGWDAAQRVVPGGFVTQFEQALANALAVVAAAGGRDDQIVRLTFYIKDKKAYTGFLSEVGAAYRRQMGRRFPAMAMVEVADLVEDGALVEVEATAALPPE